jgi:hypothetical protein
VIQGESELRPAFGPLRQRPAAGATLGSQN